MPLLNLSQALGLQPLARAVTPAELAIQLGARPCLGVGRRSNLCRRDSAAATELLAPRDLRRLRCLLRSAIRREAAALSVCSVPEHH